MLVLIILAAGLLPGGTNPHLEGAWVIKNGKHGKGYHASQAQICTTKLILTADHSFQLNQTGWHSVGRWSYRNRVLTLHCEEINQRKVSNATTFKLTHGGKRLESTLHGYSDWLENQR